MANKQVSSSKFQAQIAKYIDDALRGEETIITRWGRPVAVLKPISTEPTAEEGNETEATP